jgi:trigger factor
VLEAERETVLDMENEDPVVENLPAALEGSPVGEVRQVVWTVPADHPTHGSREATTTIEILGIADRDLPIVDAAFAKSLGAESLEELRSRAQRILEANAQYQYQRERVQAAVDALTDATEVDVPDPLVERQSDILWEEFLDNLRQHQITPEGYFQATGQTEAKIREGFRDDAVLRAKRNLVLESLARQENLLPAEGEIREAAQKLLTMDQKGAKGSKRTLTRSQREYLEDVLLRQHALNLLGQLYGGDVGSEEAPAEADTDAKTVSDEPAAGTEDSAGPQV